MRLFGRKDEQLFQLFTDSARIVVRGGDILLSVADDYNNLDKKLAELTSLENEGDLIIQELVRRLNSTFILPFDREDAFQLVQKIAATLDYITGIIDRMILYKTGKPDAQVKEMLDVLYEALLLQEKAFNLLDRIEHNKKEILKACEQIVELENKQDLFENHEHDPLTIIKWREVYEHIEMAQDYVQDVGEMITNICIKYS